MMTSGSPLSRLTQAVWPGAESGRVVVRELLPLAELGGDGAPDTERGVALAAGEGHHPHRAGLAGGVERLHDRAAVLGVLGEQAEGEQVVGLAAAHGLGELEDALGGLALQAPEALGQQDAHALGDVVLAEEGLGVDAVRDQVREVEDGVAPRGVEDAVAGFAGVAEGLHERSFLPCSACSRNGPERYSHRAT